MTNIDITGRDAMIYEKALAYAIIAIQAVPQIDQERSDMTDMCRLLRHKLSSVGINSITTAELATRRIIDLFPDRDNLSEAERVTAEVILARIGEAREEHWDRRRSVKAKRLAKETGRSEADCKHDLDGLAEHHPPAGHDKLNGITELDH